MVNAVISLFKNQSVAEVLPIIEDVLAEIEERTAEAKKKNLLITTDSGGFTEDKINMKENMVNKIMVIAGAGSVYADMIKDRELGYICNVSFRKFNRVRDTELAPMCSEIVDRVEAVKDELTSYGINDSVIADARTAIDDYLTQFGECSIFFAERSGARKDLTSIISKLRDLLSNRLDRLMEYYRKREPDLFNQYMAARVIRDL